MDNSIAESSLSPPTLRGKEERRLGLILLSLLFLPIIYLLLYSYPLLLLFLVLLLIIRELRYTCSPLLSLPLVHCFFPLSSSSPLFFSLSLPLLLPISFSSPGIRVLLFSTTFSSSSSSLFPLFLSLIVCVLC